MSITLYGISNCDKVRAARRWLDEHAIDYHFHDYRKQGIDEALLRDWCRLLGLDSVLNRRGTTWRRLDEATRAELDEDGAIALMQEQPSLIKRPLLDTGREKIVGFDPDNYQSLL